MNQKSFRAFLLGLITLSLLVSGCKNSPVEQAVSHKDDYKAAYIYGFPMIASYKAMYEFTIDKSNPQYKTPFNQLWSDQKTFTPKDTAIVTPNADTPYSFVWADLRSEPLVFCMPKIEKKRYYVAQLVDMYTFNYAYTGSRATGNDGGCFLIAGPDWKGDTPKGIKQVFHSATQFNFVIFRTQLFTPADMPNVLKIQKEYVVQPLSAYLKQPAPPAAPAIDFPKFDGDAPFKTDFPKFLSFLLQFCPVDPEDKALRDKFAQVGIAPGKSFDFASLPDVQKAELGLGVKEGFDEITKEADGLGKPVNGWRVGSAFGDRAFYHGDWLLRAAAAKAGVFGNTAEEAVYPMTRQDGSGEVIDASKHDYVITIPAGDFPPVNAFWSYTMYDGKTQLLVENPINRYLINSPMLPGLKKNPDGSVTLYLQKDAPSADKKSNWLPAPNGTVYLVLRLYWPKTEAPSILPAGDGTWKPPAVTVAK